MTNPKRNISAGGSSNGGGGDSDGEADGDPDADMEAEACGANRPTSSTGLEEIAAQFSNGQLSYAAVLKKRRSMEPSLPLGAWPRPLVSQKSQTPAGMEVNLSMHCLYSLCNQFVCSSERCVEAPLDPSSMAIWLEEAMRNGVCIFFMARTVKGLQVRNWVRALSGGQDPLQIIFLGLSCFYIKCKDYRQKFSLLSRSGAWVENLFGIPLPWEESFEPLSEFSVSCPVWILLKKVPVFLLDHVEEAVSALGKVLYFPKFGPYVHSRSFKVCILWHLDKAMPEYLKIPVNAKDALFIQLTFDPFPLACFKCNRMGHYAKVCPVSSGIADSDQLMVEGGISDNIIRDMDSLPELQSHDLSPQPGRHVEQLVETRSHPTPPLALALSTQDQNICQNSDSVRTVNPFDALVNGSSMEDNTVEKEPKVPVMVFQGAASFQGTTAQASSDRSNRKRKLKKKKKKNNKVKLEGGQKDNVDPLIYVELNDELQCSNGGDELSFKQEDGAPTVESEDTNSEEPISSVQEEVAQVADSVLPWFKAFFKEESRKYFIPVDFVVKEGKVWVSHDNMQWQIVDFFTSNDLDPSEVVFVTKDGNKVYKGSIR